MNESILNGDECTEWWLVELQSLLNEELHSYFPGEAGHRPV